MTTTQSKNYVKRRETKNRAATLHLGLKAAEELLAANRTLTQGPTAVGIKESGPYLTWAEVNLSAITHNVQEIKRLASLNKFTFTSRARPKKDQHVRVLPVIKADAYGHGMLEVALILDYLGIEFFAVSDVAEGILLRNAGVKKSILLLESTLPIYVQHIIEFDLIPTVCTWEFAQSLNRLAEKLNKKIAIHVKVDTGMGRLGVWHEEALAFVENISRLSHILIQGIYTHFPSADTDRKFTLKQIEKLKQIVTALDKKNIVIPYIHASNSMGLAGYRTSVLNLMRPGLMLYGLHPEPRLKKIADLQPALSVHSKVIFVKEIKKGRSLSYGRAFVAKKNMKVATIPIGYSDGYFRALSNNASVLIQGKRCPVLGRVTMDQIIVDVTKIDNCLAGTEVVILGRQKDDVITAEELAAHAKTIPYEVVCNLGNRLPRIYT